MIRDVAVYFKSLFKCTVCRPRSLFLIYWHGEGSAASNVTFPPHRGHRLYLGVEVQTLGNVGHYGVRLFVSRHLLSIEVGVTKEAASGAGERHHGQRNGYGDIHSNLKLC